MLKAIDAYGHKTDSHDKYDDVEEDKECLEHGYTGSIATVSNLLCQWHSLFVTDIESLIRSCVFYIFFEREMKIYSIYIFC